MKRAAFVGRVNIQRAGFDGRIIGDDANDDPLNAGEGDDDVLGEVRIDFEEFLLVHQAPDDGVDVHRRFGVGGHELIEFGIGGQIQIGGGPVRRVQHVIRGHKGKNAASDANGVRVVFRQEMNIAADAGVGGRDCRFHPSCISGR